MQHKQGNQMNNKTGYDTAISLLKEAIEKGRDEYAIQMCLTTAREEWKKAKPQPKIKILHRYTLSMAKADDHSLYPVLRPVDNEKEAFVVKLEDVKKFWDKLWPYLTHENGCTGLKNPPLSKCDCLIKKLALEAGVEL